MFVYHEQQLVGHSAKEMFGVISDIERYPEFLPGWKRARIANRQQRQWEVEQEFCIGPWCWHVSSIATLEPYTELSIQCRQGPFKNMRVAWALREEDDYRCLVDLAVQIDGMMLPGFVARRLLAVSNTNIIARMQHRIAVEQFGPI